MPRLALAGLSKTFPAAEGASLKAVDDVSLAVEPGERLALVGPSGCGKTTLLRLIAGLEGPDAGNVQCDDEDITAQPPGQREVAMVFQSHALLPHLSAFANLAFGLTVRRVARAEIATRVRETAELLGVLHCLDRKPAALSGGERQRIALGRALVRRPRVLLLDEPFASLDEPLRLHLRSELVRLTAQLELTVIHVTHDQAEALAIGDRVAVMRKGRIQQIGPPREIHDSPVNAFVAGFVGTPPMNLFHGTVTHREGHLVLAGAETDVAGVKSAFVLPLAGWRADWFSQNIGREVLLGVRPERITPVATSGVKARVVAAEYQGHETLLRLDFGGRAAAARGAGDCSLRPGEASVFSFNLKLARVFDAGTGVALF